MGAQMAVVPSEWRTTPARTPRPAGGVCMGMDAAARRNSKGQVRLWPGELSCGRVGCVTCMAQGASRVGCVTRMAQAASRVGCVTRMAQGASRVGCVTPMAQGARRLPPATSCTFACGSGHHPSSAAGFCILRTTPATAPRPVAR